jgi:hypothetical protein
MVYSNTIHLMYKELEKLTNDDMTVFEQLFRELLELQKDTGLSIPAMVQRTLRRFIDDETAMTGK